MSRFSTFRAGMYSDPSASGSEGVIDISGVLQTPSPTLSPDILSQPSEWERALSEGLVAVDAEPALYLVRAGWRDENDRAHQYSGVIGANGPTVSLLTQPTTIVVTEPAFSELLTPEGTPLVRATTANGVHFRVWPLRRLGVIETIQDAIETSAPRSTSPFALATTEQFTTPPGLLFRVP